jgi:hypothetical protein
MAKAKKRLAQEKVRRGPAPVAVTRLPVVRCAECGRPLPHQPRPGAASDVLAGHYNAEHGTP